MVYGECSRVVYLCYIGYRGAIGLGEGKVNYFESSVIMYGLWGMFWGCIKLATDGL